ncbi:MAG: hypothetical protein FJY86_03575 [Candidatus Diapherotrites archaeon]|uniref:S1 motif domain-containing protein n=1 Tax=Candidatus Iainarchaeum sp. TaxID=3101447 RepID=A0A8T4C8U3_9ARCH|nr:hypothetical protein [Candidatus Diapherotrites archaeon]
MSKEIVVPGELLTAENKQIGVHTFARDGKIFADCLGIRNESHDRISVVPLRGKYVPVENDVIIGVVKNEKFAGYDIEINSFYPSFVSNKDMREPLKVGSVISAKIVKVTEMNEAELGMVRSLNDGEVVSVTPVKVPRIHWKKRLHVECREKWNRFQYYGGKKWISLDPRRKHARSRGNHSAYRGIFSRRKLDA